MMSKIIIFIIILLMLPFVNALDYLNLCDNTSYLKKTLEFTACSGVNCTVYNFTQYVNCGFGCDNATDTCRESPIKEYTNYFLAIVGILIIIGVLAYLYKKVG